MTTMGEGRGRRALAALAELARGSARPPTPAELDSGLDALRARRDLAKQPAGRSMLRLSLVGMLAAASVLMAVSVVRSGRVRAPLPAAALAYRVEGGSLVDG